MDYKLLYYIWLGEKLYPGSVSPKILLEYYKGDIGKIYNAEREDYEALGINQKDTDRLCDKNLINATKYYEYCAKEQIGILTYDSSFYPDRLKAINDPPPMFYYKGTVEMLDDYPCFAMVGTRSCSEKGYRTAYRMGYKTAHRGAVPVNGIAAGIDGAVLRGAIDAGGYPVAFLGCGIDRVYPSSNTDLFKKVASRGLILSEFPPFSKPEGRNFPVRNRCISGISLGTVIFEADDSSGALHTAEHTLAQGRRLYAVPGDINNPLYSGPVLLIKNGATAITDADDYILEFLQMYSHRIDCTEVPFPPSEKENAAVNLAFGSPDENKEAEHPARTLPKPKRIKKKKEDFNNNDSEQTSDSCLTPNHSTDSISENSSVEKEPADLSMFSVHEKAVLSLFKKNEYLTIDDIASKGIKVDDVLSSLTMLEIYNHIESLPGGRYRLKD